MSTLRFKPIQSKLFQYITLSVFLSFIPFLRLASGNPKYLSQTLWAEDGLFTLCFKKSTILECSTDGFSGYLQGLPRFTGFIASRFDAQLWALVINVQALLIYFLLTLFLITIISYKDNLTSIKIIIAGAPTLLAFSGTEIIGVISNDYLLLYYVALVYISFYNPGTESRTIKVSAGIIFLALGLSSPFGFFAGAFLLIKMFIIRNLRKNKIMISGILLANLLQALVIVSQIGKRDQMVSLSSFLKETGLNSVKSVFYIFYTPRSGDFLPGVKFGTLAYSAAFIFLAFILFIIRKRILLYIRLKKGFNLALQLASFVLVLVVSIVTNGSVSRYLNLLMLINVLIIVSIAIMLDKNKSKLIGRTLLLFLMLNLVLNFQVSETRVSQPEWKNEWMTIKEKCDSGSEQVQLTFTPQWPTINPHPYPMFEPLTNSIGCNKI